MGSLISRPKVPQFEPQVIYVPQPVQPQPVRRSEPMVADSAPQPAQNDAASEEAEAVQNRTEKREENLLNRSRGRLGTVNTSFRGLLGAANQSSQQKTLLGE